MQRNETDRGTKRNGPFLGKRCRRATQTERTVFRTFFRRVPYHHRQGLKQGDISQKLQQEGIKATELGIAKFLAKFIESASVARKPGSGRPSKRNGPCNRTDRGTEQNGPFYAVLGKRCRPATQTERFYNFFWTHTVALKFKNTCVFTVILTRNLFFGGKSINHIFHFFQRWQRKYGMRQKKPPVHGPFHT